MNRDGKSLSRTLAEHAATIAVTLTLVILLFGGRLGLRRQPPIAQIPVLEQPTQEPPPPVPVPRGHARTDAPAPAADVRTPPPPQDVLKELDPEERDNVLVYSSVNKSVV